MRHYQVTDGASIKRLSDLAEGARARGWWQHYRLPDDKAFVDYIGYESDASKIQLTQGSNIPGLLQIEPYMRIIATAYGANSEEAEDIVALRKARQDRMASRSPQQIYILDEAALRRRVGEVCQQLRHLIALADKPTITILVILSPLVLITDWKEPVAILGFDFGLDDVLYLESARRGDLIIEPGGQTLQGHTEDVAAAEVEDVREYQSGFRSMINSAGPR